MDTAQLTTILVTAVISVIAKEVSMWLWALVKLTATTATVRAKVNAMFTKSNLDILLHLFLTGFYLYIVVSVGWTDDRVSGKDMLIIIGSLIASVFMAVSLIIKIVNAKINAKAAMPPEK